MPKYLTNEKLIKAISEPIEFDLKGRHFVVEAITPDMFKKMGVDGTDDTYYERIVSALIGEDAMAELAPIDIRELLPLAKWLSDLIGSGLQGEEKNAQELSEG